MSKATTKQLELIDEAKDLFNSMKRNFQATSEIALPQIYEILEQLGNDEEFEDDLLEPINEIDF